MEELVALKVVVSILVLMEDVKEPVIA